MKDDTRTFLIVVGSILLSAAITAGIFFGVKALKRFESTIATSVDSSSSQSVSSSIESNSSENTNNSAGSSSEPGAVVTTDPVLKGSTEKITFNTVAGQVDLPSENFVVVLSGLATDASDLDKQLFISCDDDALDSWLKLSVVRNGVEVKLSSPYKFSSGESVKVTLLKNTYDWTAYGQFYKLPLIIYATNFPDAVWFVDVYVYTV
jgi:hypothetical protein